MDTSRMDMVLNRQKRSLVQDALFLTVVIAGVLFYLFGLSASRTAVAHTPAVNAAPAQVSAPVEQSATLCAYEPAIWNC